MPARSRTGSPRGPASRASAHRSWRQACSGRARHAPVHRRIGREAGLQRKDVRRQVGEAFRYRVETGFRAEQREPRRPDVGGDQAAGGVGVEHDLEQVARIEAEDGATVGTDIADPLQPGLQPFHSIERRRKDHIMNLAGLTAALVDVADLAAEDEAHRRVTCGRNLTLDRGRRIVAEPKQTILGRYELLPHLGQPARMGDVARSDDMDPLELRPARRCSKVRFGLVAREKCEWMWRSAMSLMGAFSAFTSPAHSQLRRRKNHSIVPATSMQTPQNAG